MHCVEQGFLCPFILHEGKVCTHMYIHTHICVLIYMNVYITLLPVRLPGIKRNEAINILFSQVHHLVNCHVFDCRVVTGLLARLVACPGAVARFARKGLLGTALLALAGLTAVEVARTHLTGEQATSDRCMSCTVCLQGGTHLGLMETHLLCCDAGLLIPPSTLLCCHASSARLL